MNKTRMSEGFINPMDTLREIANDTFGMAPVKAEGQSLNSTYGFPEDYKPPKPLVETTYVERKVPDHLEDEAHELIDNWLKSKGYDPEEI